MFRAFVAKYAWNSADGHPALRIVQTSWAPVVPNEQRLDGIIGVLLPE
jgi:hypothetical protein